jgi:hypothetical protein
MREEVAMSTLKTRTEVGVGDVQHVLSAALGPKYRVTIESNSMLKVRRPGLFATKVQMKPHNGATTFKVSGSGLFVSRGIQACSVNPRVRRALKQAYPTSPG